MFVYMFIHIYMLIYACVYIHVYICIYACIHIYTHAHCMHACCICKCLFIKRLISGIKREDKFVPLARLPDTVDYPAMVIGSSVVNMGGVDGATGNEIDQSLGVGAV